MGLFLFAYNLHTKISEVLKNLIVAKLIFFTVFAIGLLKRS
jgi:hypothetical protein